MAMTPERWRRVREVFARVADADARDRERSIVELCGDDEAVEAEVRGMLAAHESDDHLEIGAPMHLESLVRSAEQAMEQDLEIDRYRVLRRLGEGGMGVVYEGERSDGTFGRRVAVKVLKRGMDTELFLRRFERERAALAVLDHPNISRMLDAGSTGDGRPFLVMELVDGVPLHEFCDANRLSVRERIGLFLQVIAAVTHAHRNLVLHRDLKPSNIFVTPDRRVKLLDFGIAKMIGGGDEDITVTRERFLTPRYASPEMIDGDALTTASDVYSLGVVLYELLTGVEPYEVEERTPRAYDRAVREQTPSLPSTAVSRRGGGTTGGVSTTALRRLLRGDLDLVLLKALAKEPSRRYRSADALGDDLQAFLHGLPVTARPDSLLYRTRKLVQRAPAPVGLTSIALAAIVALAAYSMVQRTRAERATRAVRAQLVELERQKAITDGVNTFYTQGVLGESNPEQGMSPDITIAEALDRAAMEIEERFADAPLVEAEIRNSLGYFYHQRTEYEKALPHLERAWLLYADALGAEAKKTLYAKRDYGNCLDWLGRHEEALAVLQEVLEVQRRIEPEDGYTAMTVSLVGNVLDDLGRYEEAAAYLEEAYQWRLRTWGERNGNTMTSMNNLARLYARMRKFDEALPLFERAFQLRTEEFGATHPRTLIARGNLGALLGRMGRVDEAIEILEAVRADQLDVLGEEHGHTKHVKGVIDGLRATAASGETTD